MGTRRPTQREIADALKLADPKSVREHRANGMPTDSIDAARDWYDRNIRGGDGAATDTAKRRRDGATIDPATGDMSAYQRKLRAEAACKESDAERKRLELRMQKGELVERAAVKATARKIVVAVKNRLENLPDELAMQLPPEIRPQATHDLRESVRLILVELASMNTIDESTA